MSNATAAIALDSLGAGPFTADLPVKGSTPIYRNTLVSQNSSGYVLPFSASGAGVAVGVAQHDVPSTATDGSKRVRVEMLRAYAFTNSGSDPLADTDAIGSVVYASDDHTITKGSNSQARKAVGFFLGMETDGKVRVFVHPVFARIVDALQGIADTPASADALRDAIVALFG